jgi:hypothetical protein
VCPETQPLDSELMQRKGPIPVPREFAGLVKSDLQHFAVSTMSGATICIDTSGIDEIDEVTASPDKRFLAFNWLGYEVFGYLLIDRTGKGQVVDTGNAPLAPPSGMRFAAIDLSESGFGSLNGLAVWKIEPVGLRELAMVQDGFPSGEWKMEGWAGDECLDLSVLPIDRQGGDDPDSAPRDPWFVAAKNGWKPKAGSCPEV